MAVLKANAYGAGAVGMARALSSVGVDAFAVADVREGIELRQNDVAGMILCLTYLTPDEVEAVFAYHLTPSVFTPEAARWLGEWAQAMNRRLRVWIKVDTGLRRLGVSFQAAPEFIGQIAQYRWLEIEGLFSTLTENPERDPIQVRRLLTLRDQIPELAGTLLSLASSHGILSRPDSYLDMVRPGIMLLGLEPSERKRMDLELVRLADQKPVVGWKTRVGYVKRADKGEQIGYGSRPALARDTLIATLTIGWANGYPPAMSNAGDVLIHGHRCPVISVSAHSTMVDASTVAQVAVGDQVVLVGKQGADEITAAELVRITGVNVYRLFSGVPREVPRIWE
jgi:alanine racemase